MQYFVIGDEDTVLGFRYAGVAGHVADDAAEARAALALACESEEVGTVIITQEVADMIRPDVDDRRLADELPLIVEAPGPAGPAPGRRTLTEMIREAIGVRV